MDTRSFTNAAEFLAAAEPLLSASEARNNLLYGIGAFLVDEPDEFDFRLWLVEDEGIPVAAALRTLPRRVIIADARSEDAARFLASAVIDGSDVELPGAAGAVPAVEWFVDDWRRRTGGRARCSMAQGVFALEAVRAVPAPGGRPRQATPADRDLVARWQRAFIDEVFPNDVEEDAELLRWIDNRIAGRGGSGLWLWESDGRPVAMSGHGGPTPHGIRIGPVFTPRESRGRGYATALVAAHSRRLLEDGRRFCFLYTDLANPTSNAIYERIGYRRVGEAAMYDFSAGA